MKNYIKHICLLIALIPALSFAHFGSKGPYGGEVSCAIMSADSVIYIGTYTGGVYESTNKTLATWRARPVGLKQGRISALAHTGKYLFAATPDSGIYIFDGYNGNDRYWNRRDAGIKGLKITALIALDSVSLMAGTAEDGIYKTTNKGVTWEAVNNPILHHYDVTGLIKIGQTIVYSSLTGGLWATNNDGASWHDYNDENTYHVEGTTTLNYNSSTNEIMVVNKSGLFKGDSASGYVLSNTGLPSDIVIRQISNDGDNWYLVTNKGVYSSSSAAISWSILDDNLPTSNITAVVPFGQKIVCGTRNEGIFTASTLDKIWQANNNGFNNLKTHSMTLQDSIVFVATEKGLFVSEDLATSYTSANKGLTDSLNVTDLCFGDFCTIASTKNAGIFFSPDTGQSWVAINNGLINMNVKQVYCTSNMKYAVDIENRVYKSPLHSYDWTEITSGLPSGIVVKTLTLVADKALLLNSTNEGIYRYSGSAWEEINTGLPTNNVTSSTAQGDKLFAGTWGSGVFVTDSTTINWVAVTGSLENAHTDFVENHHNKVFIQSVWENEGYVFAGYKGGLYATSDGGDNWIPGGNQFNLPTFTDVTKIDIGTGRVFVTTQNNGVYSNSLKELPVIVPTGILSENFDNSMVSLSPNPSSGTFTINTKAVIEQVSIYTTSGLLMNSVVNTDNSITVDFESGIYLVKVMTSKGTAVQKIVIK